MEEVLRQALEPVLRDLARAGLSAPRFEDWSTDPEQVGAMMWAPDGSGWSVSVPREAPLAERVAQAADQVQDWAIELQLWGTGPTNWPHCPDHPASHPMQARVVQEEAVWVCPTDPSRTEPIGG